MRSFSFFFPFVSTGVAVLSTLDDALLVFGFLGLCLGGSFCWWVLDAIFTSLFWS